MSHGRRLLEAYRISYVGAARDILRFGVATRGLWSAPAVVADPPAADLRDIYRVTAPFDAETTCARQLACRVWCLIGTTRRGRKRGVEEPQATPHQDPGDRGPDPQGRVAR
jgi:hypothetical protein